MISVWLALLSWVIVAFGQPAWLPWLAPFAAVGGYALFWHSLQKRVQRKMHRVFMASLWFASVQAIQLSWMTSIEYQGFYIIAVYISLCLWLGVQFGLLTLLVPRSGEKLNAMRLLAIASIWTLIEWGRLFLLCGFSWNPVGLALTTLPYSLQFASVFGVFGLSFWVMLVNLGVFSLLSKTKRSVKICSFWIYVALFPYLFGWTHLRFHEKRQSLYEGSVSAALVQTGLLPSEKIPLGGHFEAFISPLQQWERICTFLHREVANQCDFIVLPEAAVPFHSGSLIYPFEDVKEMFIGAFGETIESSFPAHNSAVSNAFIAQTLANHFGAHLITGMDEKDSHSTLSYNAALHFTPQSAVAERYEKRVLMPLAEYLPFEWLRPFVKAYGITHHFTHGKEAKVFQGKVPFSLTICYEETFPHIVREGRIKGAALHINMTNDSWYPFSRLAEQHFDHARIRAVETGAPLLRACNSGVTAVVDSLGRIAGRLGKRHEGGEGKGAALFLKCNTYHYKTFYTLWGDKVLMTFSGCAVLLFLVLRKKKSW